MKKIISISAVVLYYFFSSISCMQKNESLVKAAYVNVVLETIATDRPNTMALRQDGMLVFTGFDTSYERNFSYVLKKDGTYAEEGPYCGSFEDKTKDELHNSDDRPCNQKATLLITKNGCPLVVIRGNVLPSLASYVKIQRYDHKNKLRSCVGNIAMPLPPSSSSLEGDEKGIVLLNEKDAVVIVRAHEKKNYGIISCYHFSTDKHAFYIPFPLRIPENKEAYVEWKEYKEYDAAQQYFFQKSGKEAILSQVEFAQRLVHCAQDGIMTIGVNGKGIEKDGSLFSMAIITQINPITAQIKNTFGDKGSLFFRGPFVGDASRNEGMYKNPFSLSMLESLSCASDGTVWIAGRSDYGFKDTSLLIRSFTPTGEPNRMVNGNGFIIPCDGSGKYISTTHSNMEVDAQGNLIVALYDEVNAACGSECAKCNQLIVTFMQFSKEGKPLCITSSSIL